MKHLKLFNESASRFLQIADICAEYNINNYTINSDESIDVDGDVYLNDQKGLTKLPLKFNKVSGHFCCYSTRLTSLEGSPKEVGGDFDCSNCDLASLEGCPESVGGFYYCNNRIVDFKGFPKYFQGFLDIGDNPVYNVYRLFLDASKITLFNEYDIIRGDHIILDRLNDFLSHIGKPEVDSVEGYICV